MKSKDSLNKIIGINVIDNEAFNDLTDSEGEMEKKNHLIDLIDLDRTDVPNNIQLKPNAQNVSLNPFE